MSFRNVLAAPLGAAASEFRAGTSPLPARLRPDAQLGVLDATEWFGETSGGIRTYLLAKARYVAARPHLRQTIVVPGAADEVEDDHGVRIMRLRGPAIPRHRPYRFMLATRSVSRIVQHERPQVIEVGSPFLVPWIVRHAARHSAASLVYYHHTDVPRIAARAFSHARSQKWANELTWSYLRQIATRSAATIVATAGGAEELRRREFPRVMHIPLGVELSVFHPERRSLREQVRAELQLPTGPLAVFAGRFAREKELEVVLSGWERVERETGARLLLVGAGPDEARLRAHPYGSRVLFRPFMHDRLALAELLAACDLYVAPGPAETFGLAAVEAMACGTPVLSVRSGAVAEHVERSGGGMTYELGDAGDVSRAAQSILSTDLSLWSARARSYAEREHDWTSVFDRLFAVYAEIAGVAP